jgi:sugar lactone lactonase YvrE
MIDELELVQQLFDAEPARSCPASVRERVMAEVSTAAPLPPATGNGAHRSHRRPRPSSRADRSKPVPYPRYSSPPPKPPWRRPGRRAIVATIGIAVVLVAGTVALVRLKGGAERVRVEPAASNPSPLGVRTKGQATGLALLGCRPGSIVVAQAGLTYAIDYNIASGSANTGSGSAKTGPKALGEVDCYAPGSKGDTAPVESFRTGLNGPITLAFDASGNLWVGNNNNNTLVKYPQAQLDNANPVPSVVISPTGSTSPNIPAGLAPDTTGDLWISNAETNTLTEYTKDQLAKSGRPVPHTVVSYSGFYGPQAAVPDRSGDLWVAAGDSLVEFTKAGLAKSNPVPGVVISSSALGGQTSNTEGLSFDSQGDLWVSLEFSSEVVEFTGAQLAHSGSPAPHVIISSKAVSDPTGLAVDSSGNLWVCNQLSSNVVEFSKAELTKSGYPAPVREIAGPKTGLNYPNYVDIAP